MKNLDWIFLCFLCIIILAGCAKHEDVILPSRESKIPADAVKMSPESDTYPPLLHSDEYEQPVPLAVINTEGAEDSPFFYYDKLNH
jgi:hypothetical protein